MSVIKAVYFCPFLLLSIAYGQVDTAKPKLPFRTSEKVGLASISIEPTNPQTAVENPGSAGDSKEAAQTGAVASQSAASPDQNKKDLDEDLRFSISQLAYAKKKLAASEVSGDPEAIDKYKKQIAGWESRIEQRRSQLARLATEETRQLSKEDPISLSETLEVFVVEDSAYNGRYPVRKGGYIILPQVGRIPVMGKSLPSAEKAIKSVLEKNQLRVATVMVERMQGSDPDNGPLIFLAGEFKAPRPYRIPPDTRPTLLSVILASGGVTDNADLKHVRVMRVAASKGAVEEINVQGILDGDFGADLILSQGDTVLVPRVSPKVIYLTGKVKKPGAATVQPGNQLTAYEAILLNGGFDNFADLKNTYVLRTNEDSSKTRIPVDVTAIQKGRRPDVPLQGNDIIVVPEKFFSF